MPERKLFDKKHGEIIRNTGDKGGVLGLFSGDLEEHFNNYGGILRPRSPFVGVEIIEAEVKKMHQQMYVLACKHPKTNFRVVEGNLFNVIFNYFPDKPRVNKETGKPVPLFRYFHLDFGFTVGTLRRVGILHFFNKLAKWPQLKNPFYMTITVSTLLYGNVATKGFITDTIQRLFKNSLWDRAELLHIDSCGTPGNQKPPIMTALIKFTK